MAKIFGNMNIKQDGSFLVQIRIQIDHGKASNYARPQGSAKPLSGLGLQYCYEGTLQGSPRPPPQCYD